MKQIEIGDYIRILPELVLCAFGILVMMLDPLMGRSSRKGLGILSLVGCFAAMAAGFYQINWHGAAWYDMVQVDSFSIFFHVLIPCISAICILASIEYLDQQNIDSGE